MKKLMTICLVVAMILAISGAANADWLPGDDHKMHYPQLPDPIGWDVQFGWVDVADDWECTKTGPVSDIHFWYSWKNDNTAVVGAVNVKIYSDNPEGSGGYSEPDELLWERQFTADEFTSCWYGDGDQGWYDTDPTTGGWSFSDHYNFYQINIVDIVNPFLQKEGTIYWLNLTMNATYDVGWKTSQDHWNDDAVYRNYGQEDWAELRDPYTQESLDMAFVITPEPTTICLLGLGTLSFIIRRKNR